MTRDKTPKVDLRLVKPAEEVVPRELDRETDALRASLVPAELSSADHEALLALTLGDDVSDMAVEERDAADALRLALAGGGGLAGGREDAPMGALAQLAGALRAAYRGANGLDARALSHADHEVLIALGIGSDVAATDRSDVDNLRRALAARGSHDLADLACSLRMAKGGHLDERDREVLLAMTIGTDVAQLPKEQPEGLRRALEGEGSHPLADLADTLRATEGRAVLSREDGAALVAMTTGIDEVVSASDRDAADALRRALEGDSPHSLASLATSLRAAAGQLPDLDELGGERILRRAMERELSRARDRVRPRELAPSGRRAAPRGALIGSIVALAAGFALFFGSLKWLETQQGPVARTTLPTAVNAELITTRSTTELFDPLEKFPTRGGESERMRKIVASRAADLRTNRFSRWGIK